MWRLLSPSVWYGGDANDGRSHPGPASHEEVHSPRPGPEAPETVPIPGPLLAALEDVKSAFFGLCVEPGKHVLAATMEEDRVALCDLAGRHDRTRRAGRRGATESQVVFGGRRVGLRRHRVCAREGGELGLPSFEVAAALDPLDRHTLAALAAGASTRRYGRSLELLPVGELERGSSRSAVSRRFQALTEQRLAEVFSKPLHEFDFGS